MPLGSADVLTAVSTSAEPSDNVQEDTSLNPERYMLVPQTILACTPKDIFLNPERNILAIKKIHFNIHNRRIDTTQFYMSSIDNPWYPILKFLNFPVA